MYRWRQEGGMTGHQGYWKCFPSLTQEAALGGGGGGFEFWTAYCMHIVQIREILQWKKWYIIFSAQRAQWIVISRDKKNISSSIFFSGAFFFVARITLFSNESSFFYLVALITFSRNWFFFYFFALINFSKIGSMFFFKCFFFRPLSLDFGFFYLKQRN